jgi:hypothetical protein
MNDADNWNYNEDLMILSQLCYGAESTRYVA